MKRSSALSGRLVKEFRNGGASATRQVRRRVRRIIRYRGFGASRDEGRDLEQIVLVELWQAVSGPGFDSSGFWGLVEVVTTRRCIDALRRRRPEASLSEGRERSDPAANPLQAVLRRERDDLAEEVLKRLPVECRELIGQVVDQGRSYREVSAESGKTEGALRVQMHRCVRQAGRLLRELTESREENR